MVGAHVFFFVDFMKRDNVARSQFGCFRYWIFEKEQVFPSYMPYIILESIDIEY